MQDIAAQVTTWLAAHREVLVGRVIEARGLAGADAAPVAAWVAGGPAVGSAVARRAAAGGRPGLVDVQIGDDDAAAVGLACGGSARVLVQPATDLPADLWTRVAARTPVLLTTAVAGDQIGPTVAYRAADVPAAYRRLFGRGIPQVAHQGGVVAWSWWPTATLRVVGAGAIAGALLAQAELLDWAATVGDDVAAGLGPADAVIVLSHDPDVGGAALATALRGEAGYVGALGSRSTQAARRSWLTGHGVAAADIDRIHGPAGLDIGSFGPAEIAVSIVAEILATRSGTAGRSLSERPGAVHATP